MARAAQARSGLILAWLLVAAWAAVILTLSGEHFSAGATSRFLGPLLGWLVPEDPELRLKLHFWVRKSAHVIEYGIFGVLAWRAGRRSALSVARATAVALALVLALAVIDELRQAALASRTGAAGDVALDLFGAAVALSLWLALRAARRAALARQPAPGGGA